MTDADTTTQSSDTKPQQLDTSGEVQPKVGDVTKGLHLDASVDNSDQPKVVRYDVYHALPPNQHRKGEWVRYSDYVDLAGDLAQACTERDKLAEELDQNMIFLHTCEAERDKLAGELEEQVEESRMWMKRCDRRAERVRELEKQLRLNNEIRTDHDNQLFTASQEVARLREALEILAKEIIRDDDNGYDANIGSDTVELAEQALRGER